MHKMRDIIADREVFSVNADQTVKEVVDYLCERRIGAVPVREDRRVVGVFSERDLLRRVVHQGLDPNTIKVREVMSPGCHRVGPDDDYRVAKMHMYEEHVRHLVVMDEYDELLGLVSMRHLLELDVQEYADLVSKLNDRYYRSTLPRETEPVPPSE
ncbi:MAG TPA: CBS domain-containing protein [Candidatus Hydrogenedentes bacterium]|nr:CBS domain-containing protein [Candidatus Hydrogenedentota bacterium]HPG70020.1 CBS domain-containing protein [Candidatus Hydrogenedentota bacterium]